MSTWTKVTGFHDNNGGVGEVMMVDLPGGDIKVFSSISRILPEGQLSSKHYQSITNRYGDRVWEL